MLKVITDIRCTFIVISYEVLFTKRMIEKGSMFYCKKKKPFIWCLTIGVCESMLWQEKYGQGKKKEETEERKKTID